MKAYSPLRYPGSKRKLLKYLEKLLQHNKVTPRVLVEPFVGGGSVFLHFLSKDKNSKAIISDADPLVYSFWKTLFEEPDYLKRFVKRVSVDLSHFDRFRKVAAEPALHNRRQLAKACLFLNRTSFSGILNDSAGPIGGREQKSPYAIDCRFGREGLIEKIDNAAALGDRVTVWPHDWEKTLQAALSKKRYKPRDYFLYFDPPFYLKAKQLYRHYFDHAAHVRLRDRINKLNKYPWILSYDRVNQIQNLYSHLEHVHVQMPYSINSPAKRLEKELIITRLSLPRIGKTT